MVAIIDVKQFPPRLSRRTIVNSELRYGTNLLLGLERSLAEREGEEEECRCRLTMTCSKWWSDELMYLASCKTRPSAPVLATLSEPAKSTRWSLDL